MSRPLRVLNIEDSARDADLILSHLTRAGYDLTICRVETAEAMRAALATEQWDVILCDYSMPQFNALQALEVLKETELDLPFIVISGTAGESVAVEAMRAGAHDYLMKDNLVGLGTAIEREMHESQNRRARQRAESALRQSEDRYRDLVEYSHDLICTHDLDGRILSVNREAERVLGYNEASLLRVNLRNVTSQDEFEDYIARLKAAGNASGVMTVETRAGEKRIWEYANTLRTEGVASPVVRGRARDVTEHRRAEAALKASEAELRALFEAMTDVIVVLDADGRHLKIAPPNDSAENPAADRLGKTLHEVFPKQTADFFLHHVRRALEDGQLHRFEYNLPVNGSEQWFSGSVSPMTSDSVVWIARDITSRKRREAERRLIFEIIEGVITTPNLDELLKLIHQSIDKVLYAKNCYVALYDELRDLIHFEFWVDEFDDVPPPRPIGEGFTSYVLRTGQPLLLTENLKKEMYERGEVSDSGRPSACWLGVPLRTPAGTIGVLVLQHYEKDCAYSTHDLELLSSIGDQIALAIERKRAEERIRESEERYRVVAETATDVIVTIDQDSTILFVNRAVERVFGYAVSELVGKKITMLMPEYMREVHKAAISEYCSTGQKHINWDAVDLPGLHKTGREIPLELSFGEFTRNGKRYFTGIARDVTERRNAEHELSRSEERYRDIVENAHDIIYTHDLLGNYTSVNNAGEQITGYSREEALSMNILEIVAPEFIEKAREMIRRKLTGESLTAYELEIIAKDGHRIAIEVNSKLVFQDGLPVGVQGIARDVTKRKQLEEQLRQSQKMEAIGRLAGGIAHDFNNLLTAITGYSEISMKPLRDEDPLLSNLQEIKKAGDRAASLTRQLLAFSRKQVLQPKLLDLNSVVVDMERMLRRLIGADIDLCTALDPKVSSIKADPGQIEQIIMNLAVNARDAMPKGGKLTIETRNVFLDEEYARRHIAVTPGPFVMLAVSDSGAGIDSEIQTRIFDPFFTTKAVGEGTGLGLSTVYGIVKQSGGNIWVYSEVGAGTTFKIYLPSTDESAQIYKRETGHEEFLRGTETVLLAEDEAIVRNLACQVLRTYGYQVLEATDGNSALGISNNHAAPIHLLITDLIMPGMSGRNLATRLTESRPEMKVLYMSGYADAAIVHHGVLDKGANFIQKPFSTDVLAIRVREVLDTRFNELKS